MIDKTLEFLPLLDSMKDGIGSDWRLDIVSGGRYQIGYCRSCGRNVQHFRGPKSIATKFRDLTTLYILNFGPWYCSHCEKRTKCLPRIRNREPTNPVISDRLTESERIGNYIRTESSLVLRKKRAGRYSKKYREGVVVRLVTGKTNVAQLIVELNVTENDLMAWIAELIENRDNRIDELTALLRSHSRAAASRIGINDDSPRFNEADNLIEGRYERRKSDRSG